MQRSAVMILLLTLFSPFGPFAAAERGPVCREPSVVDEIAREVRAGNYYGIVNARLVTEQSTADPGIVRCQVCVQSTPYETTQFGERPVAQCVARRF